MERYCDVSGIESDTLIITNAGSWLNDKAVYCEAYNGTYKLSDTALITIRTPLKGDVNADDAFTIADVVMLQKWLICTPDASLTRWQNGDMNSDNKIDAVDLTLMKQQLIG